MTRILFIGSTAAYPEHISTARKKGYSIAVLKETVTHYDREHFDDCITVKNLCTVEEVIATLQKFHNQKPINGILTRFEPYVPLVAYVGNSFKLPSYSLKAATASRNKLVMKQTWQQHRLATARFCAIRSEKDLYSAEKQLGFPYLLKPLTGAKSRFIIKITSLQQALSAYHFIIQKLATSSNKLFSHFSSQLSQPDEQTTLIAEEYLTGKQVTTTSFVSNTAISHIALVDVETAYDYHQPHFYLVTRTTPSQLPESQQEQIKTFSSQSIHALGLTNTCVHPEIMVTPQGLFALEIAARIGGYRAGMMWEACGIDLNEIAVELALGHKVTTLPKWHKACTVVEVWPTEQGRITAIEGFDVIKKLPEVSHLTIKKKVRDYYALPPEGEKPVASFFVTSSTPQESLARAKKLLAQIYVTFEKI